VKILLLPKLLNIQTTSWETPVDRQRCQCRAIVVVFWLSYQLFVISPSNFGGFSKFFHWHSHQHYSNTTNNTTYSMENAWKGQWIFHRMPMELSMDFPWNCHVTI